MPFSAFAVIFSLSARSACAGVVNIKQQKEEQMIA